MLEALVLAALVEAAATSPVQAEEASVAPAAHAQNVEAFAAPDIQKSAPTAIVPLNRRQLADPNYRTIANQLGEVLHQQGFNLVGRGETFVNAISVEYRTARDVDGDLPDQSTDDPRVEKRLGAAVFPAYRRLTVTAYGLKQRGRPQVLWRTVMAEDGFSNDVRTTIPPLVEAGRPYFGRNLTALAVADCDDFKPPIGSHIPARACGQVRGRLGQDVVRRPQVTVGPLSVPRP